ncbi:MAG: redoxin domain-containing protein [Gammaproteobacteria bacterium]|nr:redoxin domain-containing protein [Gammaproteobacteria bacterium]NIR97081.1 redoxin domain-containing protein [Gammaproteobacteria bacterium]NIT62783.1 redoxin domain-containing protein [Gammaproteobacteria bacterium]NIV19746.1 redoxin domain-containing protein [Gammaproteobacteria bacterium]NIX11170.1 redoxin domain-containing protein [Gammaproteobacteria bacterium]
MSNKRIRVPELPTELQWFNTEAPLTLFEQRGKVTLLHFWTYSRIGCMHALSDLRYLEEKYPDGLTVIGVHSPKFPNERVGSQVQKAINRHHIRHTVAHDPELRVWKKYGIRTWPSVLFIDPEGYAVGILRGEGRRRQLDELISEHLERADAMGIRHAAPTPLQPRPEPAPVLLFPGKVLATPTRLYVADSGHNRIMEATHSGQIRRIYGSTSPGFLDGQGRDAAFCNPQGMVRLGEYLYVADTDNHAIRRIELGRGDVHTIAGTGQQWRDAGLFYHDPVQAPLNSPWDLAHHDNSLYVAMAGQHQIWRMELTHNTIGNFSGCGRENMMDGDPRSAAYAQPSGLATGEQHLYAADAQTSAVRSVRLPDGQARTLVGRGLSESGDTDGTGAEARLQHPLDVVYDPARQVLWLADTFNSKIKLLNLQTTDVATFEGCEGLNEPGGVALQGDTLWIANTNAHEILCMDVDTGACRRIELYE